MARQGDLVYTFLHVPTDMIAVGAAFLTAYYLRGNGLEIYHLPLDDYYRLIRFAVPIWILAYALVGMYGRLWLFGTLQNISHIVLSSLSGWAAFVVFLVFSKSEATLVFPRLMLIYILVFSIVFVFVGRLILRFMQKVSQALGYGRRRIMVFGAGETADALTGALQRSTDRSQTLVGHVRQAMPAALVRIIKKKGADELIFADERAGDGRSFEYLIAAQNAGAIFRSVPNVFDVQVSNVLFSTVAGTPVLTFRQTPLEGWGRIVKRLFDIIAGGVVLTFAAPFMLILAALIRVTDAGPIVYGHTRLGRDGRPFTLFKFRSMLSRYCVGPAYGGQTELEIFAAMSRPDLAAEFKRDHKVKNDPRISHIGRLMRRTRLDELPQLFNVLRGDLSLVGPRPIVTAELPKYGRWGSYLLSIKPGLTGLWQVSGGNDISYDERVALDARYVQNWSLGQDLIILIKTTLTVLSGKSAY